ncbi:glycosyltransferase [Algibacter sp. L1A34]|uniref:glycosyltransferase n=1 Tax=Algibacter sp. L1A34 TaxID=2686365 RepID=UPI00131BEE2C|nr:glycosyltransferase [Algibacter sp. L1A34]
MKSILLIMPYGSVGGMERLALHFYNYYKNQGYQVKALKFIALESDIINFNEDEFTLSNKDLSELSAFKRLYFYITGPLKLRQIIKKNDITHSIAFGDMANIFSALTYTSEFKVGSIHALKSVELNSTSFFTKITKTAYRTIYKKLNKVVCISTAIKKDLLLNCNYKFPKNLKVIYNPHDIYSIENLSKEPLDNEKEKNIFKRQTIIFIGRLSNQKSPWHLINAFNHILNKNKEVNLVFIGDGDQQVVNYIKNLIKTYNIDDKIYFLGRKSNPYKYLKQATVLALSSHYEGTPNVIVEAIALGTPVVSSNCTQGILELMSVKNQIQNKGNTITESGIITPNLYKGALGFPSSNKISKEELYFSDALLKILEDPDFKIILNLNKEQLLKKFDIEITANNYLKN